ncbi:uncharacterized protein LOC133299267 [Gastrolobium bilobum]|uniref:uncharacterized protein LOC133299267 n=1 Tax=Gastrolobium bilobum TaxID=150636 RepID=UPI002AAFD794|nr:uncharacterized protein LOC133299267 [Gastrolobium bilobum]
MLRFLSTGSNLFQSFSYSPPVIKTLRVFTPATCSTIGLAEAKVEVQELGNESKDASEVLSKWGCNDDDLMRIFSRCPSLRNADATQVQSKLCLLSGLGIRASELVKIIICRPRFFRSRYNLEERLAYLMSLFESKEKLHKAIVRNPSLLVWDNRFDIEATLVLYEELGVNKSDLIQMLLLRPMIITRTSFDDEKLEYIGRIGLSKDSKMYKYVVTLIGISRVETIREKMANLARFGFSDDEIFGLFGRAPIVLTLSTDKVQRNMTFILGTMKLEAKIVLKYPYLLYANMDTVLKPRVLVAMKIQDMDYTFHIIGPTIVRALRMSEERFLNSFVKCHHEEMANELMEIYKRTKEVKRLAESSKKCITRGFPF